MSKQQQHISHLNVYSIAMDPKYIKVLRTQTCCILE